MNTIEVCFTPKLYSEIVTKENFIVVMADILRASTSICAAFENGVEAIIPVASLEEAKAYKDKGFLVASEREGIVTGFADFGNSAFNFMTEAVKGKTIAYSTTNGTQAIEMARNAEGLVIGAFSNISILSQWLIKQNCNVVILCAGWKNKFNLEDSIFAGALIEKLKYSPTFTIACDAAEAALDLWQIAKPNPLAYIQKAAHHERLRKLNLDDVLEYSFQFDTANVVPVLTDGVLVNSY
ncbi:MAG: 2-phosphosulfolactate phosphatase [Bacteroidetes bacterium]|nr:2-phosphosulfolactate phosphatase [Bacteroidota bacterium]